MGENIIQVIPTQLALSMETVRLDNCIIGQHFGRQMFELCAILPQSQRQAPTALYHFMVISYAGRYDGFVAEKAVWFNGIREAASAYEHIIEEAQADLALSEAAKPTEAGKNEI